MANGIRKINEHIFKDGRTLNITHDVPASKLEAGTLKVGPVNGQFLFVQMDRDGHKEFKKFDPNIMFEANSINTGIIGDFQIVTQKIKDLSVTTPKLANSSVTNIKYEDLSISSNKLMDNSVITSKVLNGAITNPKIIDLAVTTSKLFQRCVTSEKIATSNVLNEHLAVNQIRNDKLFNLTVDYTKIKPYTIRGGERTTIDGTSFNGQIAEHSLTDFNMMESCIRERALEPSAVTHSKIMDNSIYASKIKELSVIDRHIGNVSGTKVVNNTISDIKLMMNSVTTSKVKDKNITRAKLEDSIQTLMDEWIRVKPSQVIFSETKTNTAWVKGNLLVRDDSSASANVELKLHGNANITGNVTAAKCFNPVFADLAEGYIPVGKIEAGEPVALCKEGGLKVEKLNIHNYQRFFGFASDEYATVFGASDEELRTGKKIAITLVGRIKVKLQDLDAKVGDFLCFTDGSFTTYPRRHIDAIGRVLEDTTDEGEYVLCQIWS